MSGAWDAVVVTRDHAAELPACLAALATTSVPPRRVVVVDNASADGSADVAAGRGIAGLRVVRNRDNLGFTGAFQQGFEQTTSPWVLSLNPDCALAPECPGRLLGRGTADDRLGAVTPKLIRAEGVALQPTGVVDAAGMVVTPSGRHFDRGAGQPDDGRWDRPAEVFGGTGAATLYRRRALEDVAYPGGEILAGSFFAYREDAELAWRLQWRGWACAYEPRATAAHRRGFRPEAGRRGHPEVNRHSVRNRFLLRLICADPGWHLRFLPWWLGRDLLVVGACLTVERSSLPALADVVRLWHDTARRRRWVQSRRTVDPRRLRRWFRTRGYVEESDER